MVPYHAQMARLGIDIGGSKVLGVVCDGPRVLRKSVAATGDDPVGAAAALAERLIDGSVDGIGLAVAAWVLQPEGRPVFTPNIPGGLPGLRERFDRWVLPVAVENDATAAAWAEFLFGAGVGKDPLVMVTVGTGIGGGLVIDGKVQRGARGFAGEFGHMPVSVDGPDCACGLKGCLEAVASGTAIARMAKEVFGDTTVLRSLAKDDVTAVTGAMVADAAGAGDEVCLRVMAEAGKALGAGLFGLAMAIDPQVIVVGGGVAEAGEMFLGPAREEVERRFAGRAAPVAIVAARAGNDAGAIGAAALVDT